MDRARLTLLNRKEKDGFLHLEARLHGGGGKPLSLRHRIPLSLKDQVTDWADPFVIGMIFPVMQLGKPVLVEGPVSPSLLFNLEEFMAMWAVWKPDRYRAVDITAEVEKEPPGQPEKGLAVMAFSGGVDSCFTAWRHRKGLAGRRTRNLLSAVFVHGFDVPLSRKTTYDNLEKRNRLLLSTIGMDLIPLLTNYREMLVGWGDSYAAALLSALALFQKKFDTALLGSSKPYSVMDPNAVWGSNPASDPLLSSDSFRVLYDGGRFSRLEKLAVVARWPEALRFLHVCWENNKTELNCCRCEKCIRTILSLRLLGLDQPPCFPETLGEEDIRSLKPHGEVAHRTLVSLVREAEKRGLSGETWVQVLKEMTGRKSWTRRFEHSARKTFFQREFPGSLLRSILYRIRSVRKQGN